MARHRARALCQGSGRVLVEGRAARAPRRLEVSRLVVLGSSGQLGTMFLDLLQARGEEFVALDQADCDLARPDHIMLPLRGARAVINCAAFTAVDAAET